MEKQKVGPFPEIKLTEINQLYSKPAEERYQKIIERFTEVYGEKPQFIARAPGRVEIYGGHLDYEGYPALPGAIEKDTLMAVSALPDSKIVNLNHIKPQKYPACSFSANAKFNQIKFPNDYAKYFYGGYKAGITDISVEKLIGMNVLLQGNIPLAAGLSSSSALCVCTALATLKAYGVTNYTKQSFLQNVIQNERGVGAACGGMDQSISALGQLNACLLIEFDPIRWKTVPMPKGCKFVTTNTLIVAQKLNKAHNSLNKKECQCKLAAQVLAKLLNIPKQNWIKFRTLRHLGDYCGLSAGSMAHLVEQFLEPKPYTIQDIEEILGEKVTDVLQDVPLWNVVYQNNKEYMLYNVARHIYTCAESELKLVEVCNSNLPDFEKMKIIGRFMTQAQKSCHTYYDISSPELQQITKLALEAGAYGSKLIGAGGGGSSVSIVEESKVDHFIEYIKDKYYSQQKIKEELDRIGLQNAMFVLEPRQGACIINL